MKTNLRSARVLLSILLATAGTACAEVEQLLCRQGGGAFAVGADSPEFLKYAPSREVQILHFTLDVTPDWKARSVTGSATVRFKPIAKPITELKLDGVELSVAGVVSSEKLLGWQATEDKVIVAFAEPIPVDREATVTVNYSTVPKQGLYFRTPEMGYKAEDMHLWTQGEPVEARHWFPSVDAPNAKFTSEMICRVPEGMTVLSNGRLVSEEKDAGTGLKAVRWLQDKPHANYLIALCAGYFKKVEDTFRDIPIAMFTPASQIDQASSSFRDTKDMLGFFEREIGVPYPWAKYYQVCVEDFGWGGMENTTLTVLNDRTLFTDATENLRDNTGLVAHELAHQWFGDLVTCKDWSHLWLNEGFATYYEALYEGHKHGRDMFLYVVRQNAEGVLNQANDTNAIVRRDFGNPEEQFGFHAYPKGSWILHMLRSQLGEDLFRRGIKTYLDRHQFGSVTTEDLNRAFEEVSGRSFDQFFNQYVYHAHHPELTISHSWDERTKLAKVSIQQVQKLSDDVLLFRVPLPVRFKSKTGVVERTFDVKAKLEDFYVPLPEKPTVVRIDPDLTVLAKINFNAPPGMLDEQATDPNDMLGRLLAVEQWSGRAEALGKLQKALTNDSFYAVRLAAARSIRAIQTDEALGALVACSRQSDARVRREVVSGIAGFYRESSYDAIRRILADEKNPDIQSLAVASLSGYAKPEVRDTLLRYLNSASYRNGLAEGAINAIRAQDDPAYLAPLLAALREKEAEFTTPGFANGMGTVAWLGRNEEKKDEAREFLLARLSSPKRRVRLAAINGLGVLGDGKGLAALEKIAGGRKEDPERTAAERAIGSLRDGRKPSVEVGSLRGEVLTLQKENRELRRDFDELKKRFEALAPKPAEGKTAKLPPAKTRR